MQQLEASSPAIKPDAATSRLSILGLSGIRIFVFSMDTLLDCA